MASQAGTFNVQEFADAGLPLVSGRLYTYAYGTTTQKTAYTDAAGTIPHTYTSDGAGGQYIALNSRGELPAPLYLTTGSYDLALKRADGSSVWTRRADGLTDYSGSTGASLIGFLQSGTGAVVRTVQSKLRDTVSVKDFGAVGDGAANDTAAIQAALNSGATSIFLPAGTYNISAQLLVPSGVKRFCGSGEASKIVATGTALAAFQPYLYFSTLNGFDISDFAISVDETAYASNHAIYLATCLNGRVRNVRILHGGYMGLYMPACSAVSVSHVQVDAFAVAGIRADTSPDHLSIENCLTMAPGSSHSIQIIGGARHKITGCSVFKAGAGVFGINLLTCSDSIISNNEVQTNTVEGINVQDSVRVSIIGNTVTALSGHHDFGISLYGSLANTQHCLIEGNRVYFTGKSGIALASSAAKACKQNHVVGNLIVSPNQLNEAQGSGVILYGSTLCSENTVQANRLLDEGSTAKYGVSEWNDGGGNPQFNHLIDNAVLTASGMVAQNLILTNTSQAWDLAKESFTPTVTSTAGTLTTVSASGAYQRRGKFVEVSLSITITTNGTGATAIQATTPLGTFISGILAGREEILTGSSLTGSLSGANLLIRKYDNSYPGGNGASLHLSGLLELQ